jgi:hypothetical protein
MQMTNRRRRLAARLLAVALLAATLTTVGSLTSPTPAEARCDGPGREFRSTFSYGGKLRASETPLNGTCNENNNYRGILKDESQDGYCVSVWFREGSDPWIQAYNGRVCGVGNTAAFDWVDGYLNNSRAYERLCIEDPLDGFLVACGWGSELNAYGTNWGF